MANTAARENESAFALVLTRRFEVPREAVFRAWTDAAQMAQWIGPPGIRAEVKAMDPRLGGSYRIAMHGEDSGKTWVVGGVYREVIPPERLVFTWTWEEDGPAHRAGHEMLVTVILKAKGRGTEMTLRHEQLDSETSRDSHAHGWGGSLDRLSEVLG
jgi:uncharacterized protein YndB with AHSA1/START domain